MGLRTRMKSHVKRLLGRPGPSPQPPAAHAPSSEPATPTVRPSRVEPPPSPAKKPAAVASTASEASLSEQSPVPAAPSEDVAADATATLREAKAAHHFEKTRRGVLRFIDEQGGETGLAEMHDHSERRYFVGHKRFSDLMEGLVAESLIAYNHGTGRAVLTEAGRVLSQTKMPPRPRG